MNTQEENQDTVQNFVPNPFPEPQTIPSGWDTSGFLLMSQPFEETQGKSASVERVDDSAKSKSN